LRVLFSVARACLRHHEITQRLQAITRTRTHRGSVVEAHLIERQRLGINAVAAQLEIDVAQACGAAGFGAAATAAVTPKKPVFAPNAASVRSTPSAAGSASISATGRPDTSAT